MYNNGIIKNLILKFAAADSAAEAFTLYDGELVKNVTYPEFAADILKAAGFFLNNQIKGQHVAIVAPNSYDWLVTYFAVIGSSNVAILMNQDLPKDILLWQCRKADVSMICSDAETLNILGVNFADAKCLPFESLRQGEAAEPQMLHSAQPGDTIQMLFTSGTTGKSKAVEHAASNWFHVMTSHDIRLAPAELNRVCIPVPFYHALGLESVIISLYYGKTVCIGRGIKYLFMDMAALNPVLLVAVPSVVESLAKILKRAVKPEDRQKYIGSKLCHIGFAGAVLKEPVLRALLDQGFTMSVNYGMSEIPGASTMCIIEDESQYRSAGKFTLNTQFRFQDGELLLNSARLMKGYYKDPEETAKVIKDGWIHTGDLGYCSAEGYFYLTGRKKNVIILSNGENVNPEEIEATFGSCPEILECMAYGDGKGICADVYTTDPDTVMAFIQKYNSGTPLYRQVYKVNCQDHPLEKTGSGKIKRKENVYV